MKKTFLKQRHFRIFCTALVCLTLSACASTNNRTEGVSYGNTHIEISDPLEDYNRAIFAVNDALDRALAEPLARGYRAVVPDPARTGVRNFLRNLRSPINAANQLLQGDIDGVATDVARAAINSTIGLLGLIDVGEYAGLHYEQEDFGQTLAVWGLGHGPYVVLPLLGPSSFRDATGMAVDAYFDPLRLYLFNTDQEEWHYARMAVSTLDKREELLDPLDDLRRHSFDVYAAARSAYYQQRQALINDQDPSTLAAPAIPDYDSDSFEE